MFSWNVCNNSVYVFHKVNIIMCHDHQNEKSIRNCVDLTENVNRFFS